MKDIYVYGNNPKARDENNNYVHSDITSILDAISSKKISSKDIENEDVESENEKYFETETKSSIINLQFNPENMVKGIIYSEILGKPKALSILNKPWIFSPFIRRK
ncbi:MAG TPA: hypothetical protein GXX37_08025 [Clostridiaceae bacterium]|nr:hypothetical protein [Clostridiaceae bacterium]